MRAILRLLTTELMRFSSYRADIIIFTCGQFVFPLIMMSVFLQVSAGIGQGLLTMVYLKQYYFAVILVNMFSGAWHGPFLGSDIRQGKILPYLMRPLDVTFWLMVVNNLGEKAWKITIAIPGLILIYHVLGQPLAQMTWLQIISFIPPVVGGTVISFLVQHCLALSAFWVSEVGALKNYNDTVSYIVSGKLYPLELLAGIVPLPLLNLLHYKYIYYFPIQALIGRLALDEYLQGLGMQLAWMSIFYLLYRTLWARGLRTYSGFGI